MGRHRKLLSDSGKARRTQQREQSIAAVEQLLYSRRQTAKALGNVSIATVQRLERAGRLDKVRLAGSGNGCVFHRAQQVYALAAGAAKPKNNSPSAAQTITPDATEPKAAAKTKRRRVARDEVVEVAE